MPRLTLRFFGVPEVLRDGAPVPEAGQYRNTELLLFLALADGPQDRASLAGRLWPDRPAEGARHHLREGLFRLRRGLGEPAELVVDRQTVRLVPGDLQVDVLEFRSLVAACAAHAHRQLETCPACLDRLERAVALYRGALLEPWDDGGDPPFEAWLSLQRAGFRRDASAAFGALSDAAALAGDHARASGFALRQLAIDPFDEAAHRRHLRALARDGRRGEATAHYEALAARLLREVGGEPDDATEELYQRILHGEPVDETRPRAPEPAPLPTRALPAPVGALIGREDELETLLALLERPDCRLVTVLGPGGVGKSRLALEAAWQRLGRFRDGVVHVDLEPVDDPAQLVTAVAAGCDVALTGASPAQAQLAEALRDKELLLVLDGFERLVDNALLVSTLLRAAPRLRVLVTSREELALRDEHLLDLDGLPTPPRGAADVRGFPAVELWVARARQVRALFRLTVEHEEPVAEICRMLQGVPLALELSAAAIRHLTPAEIELRLAEDLALLSTSLRDAPPHHRSMRAVFARSWALLPPRRQALLSRLAVFEGGFSTEAAGSVAGATAADLDAFAARSLVRRTGARWSMHLLIRRFAFEELHDPAVRAAHAAWYGAWLAGRDEALRMQAPAALRDEVAVEWENLRLAWREALNRRDAALLDTLIGPLNHVLRWHRWFARGTALLGETNTALHADPPTEPALLRVWSRIASGHGLFASLTERAEVAIAVLEDSVQVARIAGDPLQVARSLRQLGAVRRNLGDTAGGLANIEESLEWFRAHGAPADVAETLFRQGTAVYEAGDLGRAVAVLAEAVERLDALGNRPRSAQALAELGLCRVLAGDADAGMADLKRAHRLQREGGFVEVLDTMGALAQAHVELGRWREARRWAQEYQASSRPAGFLPGTCSALFWEILSASALRDVGTARQLMRELVTLAERCGSPRAAAEGLAAHAWVLEAEGQVEAARDAAATVVAMESPPSPEAVRYARVVVGRLGSGVPRDGELWAELGRVGRL